uniref:Dynein assembly factor with WDR repeat domains 1 n=1 Tax=Sphaeramia orbicularis TaxID=375764 RepID=A0A672Z1J3_9TELE
MKLKRFLLRYYPPGIVIEYEKGGHLKTKSIDLLDLSSEYVSYELVAEIMQSEPLITESRADQVKQLILRLKQKKGQQNHRRFCFTKELKAHILPLTNVAFNKSGSRFITGSYDRTCRVWDTASGTELHTLEGHRNVVYAIAFNNPYGDKIATGSFDKTCKLWCVETGKCFHTFQGHMAEIVCLAFNPQSTLVATGSMDATAKLWNVETGEEVATLDGHTAEVLSLCFDTLGNQLVTGSFDHTVAIWDVASGRRIHTLVGHSGEISNVQFNWDCSLIVTGSMDKTCKLWEASSGKCVATLGGHKEEVLDVCFDLTGQIIATASADGETTNYDPTIVVHYHFNHSWHYILFSTLSSSAPHVE